MPKKTKREKIRASRRPINVGAITPRAVEPLRESSAPRAAVSAAARSTSASAAAEMRFDYTYVYRDLRRILLLAGFFFAVLIALSFVIK